MPYLRNGYGRDETYETKYTGRVKILSNDRGA
jgi:hypothetical protein